MNNKSAITLWSENVQWFPHCTTIYPFVLGVYLAVTPPPTSLPLPKVSPQPPYTARCTQKCHHFSRWPAFTSTVPSVCSDFSPHHSPANFYFCFDTQPSVTSSWSPLVLISSLPSAPQGMWTNFCYHKCMHEDNECIYLCYRLAALMRSSPCSAHSILKKIFKN